MRCRFFIYRIFLYTTLAGDELRMSVFGLYYTKNMLTIMKWPRTQGLLKKQYIDSAIFDSTIDQMVDWAAALGAGKPNLSLQIIAYMFKDADWESADAPKIKMFVDEMRAEHQNRGGNSGEKSPHDIIQPVRIAERFGSTIKPEALQDKRLIGRLEQDFLHGLLYGFSNPTQYEAWYSNYLDDYKKNLALHQKMGLGVEKLPSLSESYGNSEEIIRNYEQEMKIQLLPILPQLLAEANAVRAT